ncbi:MAG: transcription antitermination factor NusB [Gammaproteobacteria bacterium]|nr:transcription antitermination factor NusB [Gammaproteobacteria bacterium]
MARRRARRLLAQALYQWQLSGADIADVEAQFRDDEGFGRVDAEFFHEVLRGVAEHAEALDALVAPLLDRTVAQLDHVERALLRLGTYELVHRIEVPWRVVIDECVTLARTFGAEESHKYINAVLDSLARSQRTREVAGDG